MNKMKKTLMAAAVVFGTCASPMAAFQSIGQELTDASGNAVSSDAAKIRFHFSKNAFTYIENNIPFRSI